MCVFTTVGRFIYFIFTSSTMLKGLMQRPNSHVARLCVSKDDMNNVTYVSLDINQTTPLLAY